MSDSTKKSAGLFDQPLVVEGKRRRKGIETFAITHEAKRPVLEYKGGTGIKLGDIAQVKEYIARHAAEELKPLHRICLDRPGSRLEVKKNLREFTGFTFEKDSEQYMRKKASLDKLTKTDLKGFLDALALPRNGSKEEQMERILDFLLNPHNSRRAMKRRRKSSTNKKIKVGFSGESKKKPKLSSGEETASDEESENEEADEEEGGQDVDSEIEEEKQEENQVEVDRIETKEEVKQKSKVIETCREPDDSELMETVKAIVKVADLQQATTKSVCMQVYSRYPGVDLSKRKKYIVACIEIATATL